VHHCRDDVAGVSRIGVGREFREGIEVNTIYWIAGFVALALSIYLTVALLKPEWFE